MSTNDPLGSILNSYRMRNTVPGAQSNLGFTPVPDNTLALLGLDRPPLKEEDEDDSILKSIIAGAGAGLLEPLSIIPQVREQVETLRAWGSANQTAEKLGYGMGWLAGMLVPGGIATKVGSKTVMALNGLSGMRLLKAADAGVELTRMGIATQGAVAGALLSGGAADPNLESIAKHTMAGAAFGAAGDVVVQSAFRAISGSGLFGRASKQVEDAAQKFIKGEELDLPEVEAYAQAQSMIDNLFARPYGPEEPSIVKKKYNMMLGLVETDLLNWKDGTIRVLPHIGDPDSFKEVLRNMDGVEFAEVYRPVSFKRGEGVERQFVRDFLVGKGISLNPEEVNMFRQHGFVPGQNVIRDGNRYIAIRPAGDNTIMAVKADKTGKMTPLLRDDKLFFEPLITPTRNIPELRNTSELWSQFVQRFEKGIGAARFTNFEGGPKALEDFVPVEGFNSVFDQFADELALPAGARQTLKLNFLKRQNEYLRSVDPEVADVLDNITARVKPGSSHPDGPLAELAAQKGFYVQKIMRAVPSKRPGGPSRIRYETGIFDHETGLLMYQSNRNKNLERFINKYPREAKQLDDFSPLGEGALGTPGKGIAVVPGMQMTHMANTRIPWNITILNDYLPRWAQINTIQNFLDKELGANALDIAGPYNRLIDALTKKRVEAQPFIERLNKIRGGGLFSSANIRYEMRDAVVDLAEFAKPDSPEWLEEAARLGLNKKEMQAVREVRTLYNDLFDYLSKQEAIDLTPDQFIENYFPHVRKLSDKDFKQFMVDNRMRIGSKTAEFMHELRREGMLSERDKDLFRITMHYINTGFYKAHVSSAYKEFTDMMMQIPTHNMEGKINPGMHNLQQMIAEVAATVHGHMPSAVYAIDAGARDFLASFKINMDDRTWDRFTATLMSNNYGAFMGFRPALVLRDLSQLVTATLPALGSAKYLGWGIKHAVAEGAEKELIEVGALVPHSMGVPHDELLYNMAMVDAVRNSGKRAVVAKALDKTLETSRSVTKLGLRGQGFSDALIRKVSYYGQKQKTLDMIDAWRKNGWSINEFNERVGLSVLGSGIAREFHQKLNTDGTLAAAQLLAKRFTQDTAFVFNQNAGPRMFQSQVGRLFGQYGTWPMWYVSFLRNRLTRGSYKERVKFAAWTGAVHYALINSAYTSGVNLSSWTPLSFDWAGGPFFDKFKDLTDVVSGKDPMGEPTAKRSLALGKHGLVDDDDFFFSLKGATPAEKLKSFSQLMQGTVGMFVPGTYFLKDVMDSTEETDGVTAAQRAMGFHPQTIAPSFTIE